MTETYVVHVPIHKIKDNPWQTRTLDDEHVHDLAESIQRDGLIQKPAGRAVAENTDRVISISSIRAMEEDLFDIADRYVQLAVGHHRVAAYRLLVEEDPEQYGTIPVEIGPFTDEQMADAGEVFLNVAGAYRIALAGSTVLDDLYDAGRVRKATGGIGERLAQMKQWIRGGSNTSD